MEQAAEQITDHLVSAIKSQKTFYTLQDLRQNGYPNFVVERIRLAVYDRFMSDFPVAESPWINPDDENLKQSLAAFRQAVFNACIIPQGELYPVTRKVVSGIINVLLRSRSALAEYIYRGQDVLTYEEMLDRTSRLTVHRHFAQAIPKYMQKRSLSSLTKERCATLIQKLDANLTAAYSPEEWVASLELLFTLFDGEVDARLLSIYFEDKNYHFAKNAVARIGGSITQKALVQILSARAEESTSGSMPPGEKAENPLAAAAGDDEAEEGEEDETSLNAMFRESQNIKTISDNFEDEDSGAMAMQPGDAAEQSNPLHKNLASVLDIAAESFRSLASEYDEEDDDEHDHTAEQKQPEEIVNEREADAEPSKAETLQNEHDHEPAAEPAEQTHEALIWQQFLTDEHRDIITGKSGAQQTEEEIIFLDEDDIIDEAPLFENARTPPQEPGKEELNVYLMGQEVFFIEELFNGSERKYQQALVKVDKFTDWNEASEYIFEHIFATHHIDLSSEAAVDFIDRLQAYFTEFKN